MGFSLPGSSVHRIAGQFFTAETPGEHYEETTIFNTKLEGIIPVKSVALPWIRNIWLKHNFSFDRLHLDTYHSINGQRCHSINSKSWILTKTKESREVEDYRISINKNVMGRSYLLLFCFFFFFLPVQAKDIFCISLEKTNLLIHNCKKGLKNLEYTDDFCWINSTHF